MKKLKNIFCSPNAPLAYTNRQSPCSKPAVFYWRRFNLRRLRKPFLYCIYLRFSAWSHVFLRKKLGVSIVRIEILPFGICGKLSAGFIKNPYKRSCNRRSRIYAFSGALALLYMLNKNPMLSVYSEAIDYGIKINLSLMILNLVPALPLDGGRIAKAIISINLGAVRVSNLMLKISRVPIIGMLLVSVWLLLTNDFNLSLILIGAFLLET